MDDERYMAWFATIRQRHRIGWFFIPIVALLAWDCLDCGCIGSMIHREPHGRFGLDFNNRLLSSTSRRTASRPARAEEVSPHFEPMDRDQLLDGHPGIFDGQDARGH